MGHPEYIPAVTTDFIFSAIFEEFGFLGAAAVIVVYFLMVYRGIKISISVENSYLKLAALSITTMFGFQIITIIGGVTKLIPLTGSHIAFYELWWELHGYEFCFTSYFKWHMAEGKRGRER